MTADEIAKRPTPLTDAKWREVMENLPFTLASTNRLWALGEIVPAACARQLERERAALMKELMAVRHWIGENVSYAQSVEVLEPLDETLAAVRQRQEAMMDDLKITRRCAEAMELRDISTHDNRSVWFYDKGRDSVETYDPLHDDAQAMALVKRFGVSLIYNGTLCPTTWSAGREGIEVGEFDSDSDDLNRAIATCVAKMQEAKHG